MDQLKENRNNQYWSEEKKCLVNVKKNDPSEYWSKEKKIYSKEILEYVGKNRNENTLLPRKETSLLYNTKETIHEYTVVPGDEKCPCGRSIPPIPSHTF